METDIRVAVAVLYAHNHISNYCNTGPVAEELLARGLCVIFLRFYELVVEVNVIRPALTELSQESNTLTSNVLSLSTVLSP